MNKRGQGLSTNAIILIILAVVVLVVLIMGFVLGWGKIAPFLSTDNVDTIANSCAAACSTSAQYEYCSASRELKAGGDTLKDVTCDYLAKKEKVYGVDECPSITCTALLSTKGNELDARTEMCFDGDGVAINFGATVMYLEKEMLTSTKCPKLEELEESTS